MDLSIEDLVKGVYGKTIGSNQYYFEDGFSGKFGFLGDGEPGDIVIRHKINSKGIEIAASKKLACIITQNIEGNGIETSESLKFPVILVDKIEIANAFALNWTIEKYDPESRKLVVTGTNGKSTTSHMIHHILKHSGAHVFTNTDAKSEFNTLIDPMVSKLIYDEVKSNGSLDYSVIEVSEVQGWLDNLMKNHAYLMTTAINPDVGIITNVAMDHIGLVNSIEEVFTETSGLARGLNKGSIVLNKDDDLVKDIEVEDIDKIFFSMNNKYSDGNVVYDSEKELVLYDNKKILTIDELPFNTDHFIQNTLASICGCIKLGLSIEDIVKGVKTYKSLKRRFVRLSEEPLIIDDFAHNPDGIKSTVYASYNLLESEDSTLYIFNAIRGSRGEVLNKLNAQALQEVISKIKNENPNQKLDLSLSISSDVVDNLNIVTPSEKEVFLSVFNENNEDYTLYENLIDGLKNIVKSAQKNDIILLIGAQGMDPAEELLKDILN